ncbi:MAG: hypothetical protein ACTSQE_14265 [Candidatus Heimdallarchaeaceae archaeon]
MDKTKINWFILKIAILAMFCALFSIFLCLSFPQSNVQKTSIFGLIIFFNLSLILLLIFPELNERFIEVLRRKSVLFYSLVAFYLFLPLLSIIFVQETIVALFSFLGWYALPTIAFLQVYYYKIYSNKIVLFVSGVLIFALGLAFNYTDIIVSGFDRLTFFLKRVWVMALLLLLYSVQIKENRKKGKKIRFRIKRI